jgi:hypothetical protein
VPIRFRPPRDVPDLGLTRGQQERFNAWLRTAFIEIAEDMATLGQTDAPTIVAQETIDVAAGSLRRVTPPSGGMAVRVPAPTPANAGQTVRLMIEAPVGDLAVVAVPGIGDDGKVFQPTINGEQRATFSASGLVTLTSNGSSDWKSASEFAAESPASIAISSGGAALDATYLLRSANAQLPNARVADDSTEIEPDYSAPGLISWFLNTASVAFSKLANLAGLSVLGRATNSSGVMAAITATAARHVLRNNDAGTSLEWDFPLEAQQDGVDLGNVHTINREDGRLTVAAGVATFDAPTTVVDTQSGTLNAYALPATLQHGDTLAIVCSADVTLNGIVAKPAGFGFYLNVSGAAARILTINDESGSAAALNRLSLPADLASRNPPGASFWVSYASTRWLVVERAITEIQDGGSSQGFARTINAADTTSITGTATISSGTASLSFTRAALTGFAAASANSNATTSAEPIVTYSASANMSAERVTTTSATIAINISVAGQIAFDVVDASITAAKMFSLAAFSVLGRAGSGTGVMAAITSSGAGSVLRDNGATGIGFGTLLASSFADATISRSRWTNMAAATVAGRARGAGTGAPSDLTGTEVGVICRWESFVVDSTSSGTIALYAIAESTNQVNFKLASNIIIQGMTATSATFGKKVVFQCDRGFAGTVTWEDESASAASALERVRNPGTRSFTIREGESATYDYWDSRWRLAAFSKLTNPDLLGPPDAFGAAPTFDLRVSFSATGATGTLVDVNVWNANAPFALRILRAKLRVSTAAGTACALRTAAAGAGSVVLPDAGAATQTFDTSAAGHFDDNAAATATVAASGSVFFNVDRAVAGELILTCVRT